MEQPDHLVNVTRLELAQIEELSNGRVRIGSMARNSTTANHPLRESTLSRTISGFIGGGISPVTQYGYRWGKFDAAHSLLLFYRYYYAL